MNDKQREQLRARLGEYDDLMFMSKLSLAASAAQLVAFDDLPEGVTVTDQERAAVREHIRQERLNLHSLEAAQDALRALEGDW